MNFLKHSTVYYYSQSIDYYVRSSERILIDEYDKESFEKDDSASSFEKEEISVSFTTKGNILIRDTNVGDY